METENKKVICHLCLHGPYNEGWNYQENVLPKYHVKAGMKVYQIVTPYIWEGTKIAYSTDTHYISPDGVEIYRCKKSKGPTFGGRITHYPEVMSLLESISPDILFIHDLQCIDMLTVVKYLKKHRDCTVYVDNHSDFSNSATNWISKNILHKILWKHMAQILVPYTEKFYGVLPARVDFLVNMYGLPRDKVELLVMGADDELVEKATAKETVLETRKKYGIADDDFLIITGGKIDLWKQQTLTLMESVNEINYDRLKLIVFGSIAPELKERLEGLCSERVKYIGWLDSKDTYPLVASSQLAVFPGRHSVFWEQVCGQGIPMIVKEWDGTKHVDVGGNVSFLKTDGKEEIKAKISSLLDNPDEYEKMKAVAEGEGKGTFLYSRIAKNAINSKI